MIHQPSQKIRFTVYVVVGFKLLGSPTRKQDPHSSFLTISLLKTNLDTGGTLPHPVNDFICMTAFNVFATWKFAVTNMENLTCLSAMEEVKHRKDIQHRPESLLQITCNFNINTCQ